MNRYSKYALQSALDLTDGFCRYLIQDRCWGAQEILDAETVVYDFDADAEQMLWECLTYGDPTAIGRLRYFLAEDCRVHLVHRMDDRRVVRESARQLTHHSYQVVLEPGLGWAVQLDAATAVPVVPVAVEPEPDITCELSSIKADLDEIVRSQKKKYDAYEAVLAKMNDSQKAALYAAKTGKGIVNAIKDMVVFLKQLPTLYVEGLKLEWKIITFPARATLAAFRSAITLDIEPLHQEFTKAYSPFTETREQALEYGSTAWMLLLDAEARDMLVDFSERYWKATHPLEKTEVTASAFSDITMTIILALISGGVGALGNVMLKSQRLVKVAEKLKKLAQLLKKTGYRQKLAKVDDAGLHNREWDNVHVEKFKTRRKVDVKDLQKKDAIAAKTLERQGWKQNKIEEILSSGDTFTTKTLQPGDRLYGFNTAGRGKDIKNSAYWLDENGFKDVQNKFYKEGAWDRENVKNYLALPCYNRATAMDVAEVSKSTTAIESTIGKATELIQYSDKGGYNTGLLGKIMGGGGTQVTVAPSAIKPLSGL